MKKILKKAFGYHSISYYSIIYEYDGKPDIGYVIVLNERIFFIPTHRKLSVALDKKELHSKLNFYKKFYNL